MKEQSKGEHVVAKMELTSGLLMRKVKRLPVGSMEPVESISLLLKPQWGQLKEITTTSLKKGIFVSSNRVSPYKKRQSEPNSRGTASATCSPQFMQ